MSSHTDVQAEERGTHGIKETHFGYQTIPEEEKADRVADVFTSVAANYDLMNDLMSLGVHRLWKCFTIAEANARVGDSVLDIAGGTGDLAAAFSKRVGETGKVVLADINAAMLNVGRERLIDRGIIGNLKFIQANAESLPFPDNTFNLITIAFGLRNVTHIDSALASMYRVLRPGGKCLILEFSKPTWPGLKPIYDAYSFSVLPKLGEWVADDRESYQYLAESIRMHPDQEKLRSMMDEVGFEDSSYFNLSGGIVALHRGNKY